MYHVTQNRVFSGVLLRIIYQMLSTVTVHCFTCTNWSCKIFLGWCRASSRSASVPAWTLRLKTLLALCSPSHFQGKSSGKAMRSVTVFLIFFYCVGLIGSKPSPCPSGQFLLKSQCVLCHPTCSECVGHELFECTTCGVGEDGQERFLHQGRCRTHCPRELYPDRGHYACLPCRANCELCTDGNICAKCREHYKLQNGVCQTASCDIGQVQDPDTGECFDCEMGCKTCSTEDPEICSSCVEGKRQALVFLPAAIVSELMDAVRHLQLFLFKQLLHLSTNSTATHSEAPLGLSVVRSLT